MMLRSYLVLRTTAPERGVMYEYEGKDLSQAEITTQSRKEGLDDWMEVDRPSSPGVRGLAV